MYQGALVSGFANILVHLNKLANNRVRKEKRQGRKKSPSPLNYAPTGPFRTIFIFFKLLNFAVDPENHTETYSGLSYKPAGNLITLTTTGFVPFRPPPC